MGVTDPDDIAYSPVVAAVKNFFVKPVVWVRENIVEPNRPTYYWYHRKYQRVPTVDQCYDDDFLCKWEATYQLKRDKKVEAKMVELLRARYDDCIFYEGQNDAAAKICAPYVDKWEEAATAWFTKYGDMPWCITAEMVFYKQMHRLIWERRHGEVGTGQKDKNGNRIPLEQLKLPERPPMK